MCVQEHLGTDKGLDFFGVRASTDFPSFYMGTGVLMGRGPPKPARKKRKSFSNSWVSGHLRVVCFRKHFKPNMEGVQTVLMGVDWVEH